MCVSRESEEGGPEKASKLYGAKGHGYIIVVERTGETRQRRAKAAEHSNEGYDVGMR